MSFLWLSLSLLCATTFKQSRASGEGVSLTCNNTMEVEAGNTVTLNCTINFQGLDENCTAIQYNWKNTRSIILCDRDMTKFTCKWDNLTYVSLTISDVTERENYTAEVQTDCGMATSSVEVEVKPPTIIIGGVKSRQVPVKKTNVAVILGVSLTVIVVSILLLLYEFKRSQICTRHTAGFQTLGTVFFTPHGLFDITLPSSYWV